MQGEWAKLSAGDDKHKNWVYPWQLANELIKGFRKATSARSLKNVGIKKNLIKVNVRRAKKFPPAKKSFMWGTGEDRSSDNGGTGLTNQDRTFNEGDRE